MRNAVNLYNSWELTTFKSVILLLTEALFRLIAAKFRHFLISPFRVLNTCSSDYSYSCPFFIPVYLYSNIKLSLQYQRTVKQTVIEKPVNPSLQNLVLMYSQTLRSNFERNVWNPVRRVDSSILCFRSTWLTENTNTCAWMVPQKSPTEETWWLTSNPSKSYYNCQPSLFKSQEWSKCIFLTWYRYIIRKRVTRNGLLTRFFSICFRVCLHLYLSECGSIFHC